MSKPKIYFIKPHSGWTSWDKWRYADPAALNNFRRRGYDVIEKCGCTVEDFRKIISQPDTYGFIIASHGVKFGGIGIDPSTAEEAQTLRRTGVPKTLHPQLITNSSVPWEKGTGAVSSNLLFAAFVGCHMNEEMLQHYATQLGIGRSQIYTADPRKEPLLSWLAFEFGSNKNYVSFSQLNEVISAAFAGIIHHAESAVPVPFVPPAGIRPQTMNEAKRSYRSIVPIIRDMGQQTQFPKRPILDQLQTAQQAAERAMKNAQQFAQDAARRAIENAQRQAQKEAETRRRLQETQRRATEETQRHRAQEEAERRRAEEAADRRAQEEAQQRQLKLELARIRRSNVSTVRPEFWPKPKGGPIPRYHHLSMTFGPTEVFFPGKAPFVLNTQRTHHWTSRW